MEIRGMAHRVARKFQTVDPFRIADGLGMVVIFAPMADIRGLRQFVHRRTVIYINSLLDEHQQRLVCAHELGHHFLHRRMNRIFMDRATSMVTQKYENEANAFALELVYPDEDLYPFLKRPIADAASYMGIAEPAAAQRLSTIKPSEKELEALL